MTSPSPAMSPGEAFTQARALLVRGDAVQAERL